MREFLVDLLFLFAMIVCVIVHVIFNIPSKILEKLGVKDETGSE